METRSLKIGNYVQHDGKIIAVTSVFPKGINARTDVTTGKITYIHADEIQPIPLSTDLLRRLGLQQTSTRWTIRNHSNLYVDRAVDKYRISIGNMGSSVCPVKYVHQLQNLFSDGFEVELKLRR